MANHTPGPWTWSESDDGWSHPARTWLSGPNDPRGFVLLGVGEHADGTILIPNQADADLIAAAPDLLEACRFALAGIRQLGSDWGDEAESRLIAVIEKATKQENTPVEPLASR